MNDALLELYRHKTWATLKLIELCQSLDDEYLDATIPGTYGTVRETLRHLVNAEEGYFRQLTLKRFWEPLPQRPIVLDELAMRIRTLGPRWEALTQDPELAVREVTSTDGFRFPGWVSFAQAIHHADDHRTQILSILGARGVEVPDLAIWGYAESAGVMHEIQPTESGT